MRIVWFLAIQHGYDYQRVTAPPVSDHHATWVKIAHLYHFVHRYDIVALFDGDVYINHPNISLEFLMAKYNFTDNSSLLLPVDPSFEFNHDSKNRPTLNTGFMIAQNNNITRHILKQWALCTETVPNCTQWRYIWSHEQRAFSEYFRDQMKLGSELIIGPCNELNGYDTSDSGCLGTFVSHVWTEKQTMMERLKKIMLTNLMTLLEQHMWEDKHVFVASTNDIEKLGNPSDIQLTTNPPKI
jgi:hypothetical protein